MGQKQHSQPRHGSDSQLTSQKKFVKLYICYYERTYDLDIVDGVKNMIVSYSKPNRFGWDSKYALNDADKLIELSNWNSTISIENNDNKRKSFLLSQPVLNLNDMIKICKEQDLNLFRLIFDFEMTQESSISVGFYHFQYKKLKEGLKCLTDDNNTVNLYEDLHCSVDLKNGSKQIMGHYADDGWSSSSATLKNKIVLGNTENIQSILIEFKDVSGYYECTVYFAERLRGYYPKNEFKWTHKQSLFCDAYRMIENKKVHCTEMDRCGSQIVPFCSVNDCGQVTIVSNVDI